MQLPLDNINVTCCIREVDDKSNDVNIYMYEGSEQLFVFEGVCDENSLRMNALTIDKNAEINGFGEVSFNATIGATRIGKPVDGKLSWESVVAGNVGLNMIGMPDQASISGTMTFSGNKQ